MAKPGDPVVSLEGVHHRYAAREILAGVSLTVHCGECVGLIGVNGAGKSTLLKALAGQLRPDVGQVVVRRGASLAYLSQDHNWDEGVTVEEAVLSGAAPLREALQRYVELGDRLAANGDDAALLEAHTALAEWLELHGAWNLERDAQMIRQHLCVPAPERLVAGLSGGERRRVALAQALVAKPDCLILDEPTNHLDAASIAWLETYLRGFGGSCLLVTHDRYFLDRIADRIIELEAGSLTGYAGNYSAYLEAKMARQAADAHRERARQNLLRRELAWVRKQPKARQAKSQAREAAYEALAAEAGPLVLDDVELRIPTGEFRLGKQILELKNVGHAIAGRTLFKGLSLSLSAGDRIGVVGANGLGKTTLMRIVQGLIQPDAGEVTIGANTRFVYAEQGREQLDCTKTLLSEVVGDGLYLTVDGQTITARTYLKRFLFDDDQANQVLSRFSGGEQNRAQLAKLLARGGNVLILDEPTNDLDLPTLRVLEEALLTFPGCVFAVSHDRYFLNRVATWILAFEGDGQVVLHPGNYDSYLASRERDTNTGTVPLAQVGKGEDKDPVQVTPRRLSYKEKRELEAIEQLLADDEAALQAIESQLADPRLYVDAVSQVAPLMQEAERLRACIDGRYARWEELEALV